MRTYGGHVDVLLPAILNAGFGSRTRLKGPAVLATCCAVKTIDGMSALVLRY